MSALAISPLFYSPQKRPRKIGSKDLGAVLMLIWLNHSTKKNCLSRLEKLVELRKALQANNSGVDIFSKKVIAKKEPSLDDRFLLKLINVVQDRLDDPELSVTHLCQEVKRSNTQVNRKLKALTGKTPSQFIRSIRLQKAVELLKTTELNISEIAYDVGFSDPNYFSRSFSEEFGHPPNSVRS